MENKEVKQETNLNVIPKARVYYNMTEKEPTVKQPAGLMRERLFPHQLTFIAAALDREKACSITIEHPDENESIVKFIKSRFLNHDNFSEMKRSIYTVRSNAAILSDLAGAGKSYEILALIGISAITVKSEKIVKAEERYSIGSLSGQEPVKANLIVLPENLVYQWTEFTNRTRLRYLLISKPEDLQQFYTEPEYQILNKSKVNHKDDQLIYEMTQKTKLPNGKKVEGSDDYVYAIRKIDVKKIRKTLNEVDIVFLNVTKYRDFHKIFKSILWSRLIIDEIGTTELSPLFDEQANFTWFITATPTDIQKSDRTGYAKKFLGSHPELLDYFVVKNDDSYVKKSMDLPRPFVYMINTRLNRVINKFRDMMPEEVMKLANSGNIYEAIVQLNCGIQTEDSLFTILTDKIILEIRNLKKKIKYEKSLEYKDEKEKEAKKANIKKLKHDLERLKTRKISIKERVDELNKQGVCQMCSEDYDDKDRCPLFMKCCSQHFCTHCLFQYIKNPFCPFCKEPMKGKESYTVLARKTVVQKPKDEIKNFSKLEKIDALNIILHQIKKIDKKPSILIFSNYKDTFTKIISVIKKAELTHERLDGSAEAIRKVLIKYDNKDINILMLDATHYGSGLNLQVCDYLILFHRLSKELEEQVIARSNRYGRIKPLRIFYLVNNESESDKTILTDNPYQMKDTNDLWLIKDPPETKPNKLKDFKQELEEKKIVVEEEEKKKPKAKEESDIEYDSDEEEDEETESDEEKVEKKKNKPKAVESESESSSEEEKVPKKKKNKPKAVKSESESDSSSEEEVKPKLKQKPKAKPKKKAKTKGK